MDREHVRAYVGRDWAQGETEERAHWAEVYRRDGPRALWDAARALFANMRTIQPAFPDDRSRAEDLAHHLAPKDCLDRASHAFTGRVSSLQRSRVPSHART